MRNQTPFALCIIGGLLLIGANYTHGTATIVLIYILVHSIAPLAPLYLLIDIILVILWLIAWLGGFAVIIGGYLLTTSHIRTGKFIIAISAGFGLISLILMIWWVVASIGWAGLLILTWLILHTALALGLVLTVIARSIAH
ncbi:MAG: hypothetical protein JW779_03540 [Candidatus Thorarchaeota archaeon]|nr:hypothetical protein [Candidatus Thorarchaeota archaeon]